VTRLIVCGELEGIMKNLLWLNCKRHVWKVKIHHM